MEYRYYITTTLAVIVLQLLIWNLSATLSWLLNLSQSMRRRLLWVSYLTIDTFVLLSLTKIFHQPRWVALILALLLFAFFIRLASACLYLLSGRNASVNRYLKISYPVAFSAFVGLSVYNAYVPKVVHYSISLDKPLSEPLRIGLASDTHLGTLFGAKQLERLAEIFAQEKVDLILLPGDVMDDNLNAFQAENMLPHLAKLRAPLGVYATLGNHDFFGSQYAIAQEIQRAGIRVLWDQALEIEGKFTLIGRNDDLVKTRPSTEILLQGVNQQLPIFLLDHRPTEIEKHSKLPIDLQVSGHTHKGQIFPANLITALIYRLDYGYEKIGLGHYVVTSGYGFWGIPMRLGSQSEVVILDVTGTQ